VRIERQFDTVRAMSAMSAPRAGLARSLTLARDRLLAVPDALAPLFPGGGLRRGSTVVVRPGPAPGATTLALALISAASQTGSWCAAVGLPALGLVMSAELGISLERLALVPDPGDRWSAVTAALVDALDVVLVWPPHRCRPDDARRLAARARERGAVLVPVGAGWPEGADLRLTVTAGAWQGLGQGHGHLRAREAWVSAQGRGAAARERRVQLWLPGTAGAVEARDVTAALEGTTDATGAARDGGRRSPAPASPADRAVAG
jgi:hypothetical protein